MSENSSENEFKITITDIIQKLLIKLNIRNYKFDIVPATSKGDNYISTVFRVHVTGTNDKKEEVRKYFIAKVADRTEEARNAVPVRIAFETETRFYEKILPVLMEFQEERSVKTPFRNVSKFYLSSLEERREVIIFEDLRALGFELWNRKLPMPAQYISFVLSEYGRYHALSFALREQKPELFHKLTENMQDSIKTGVEIHNQKTRDAIDRQFKAHISNLRENGEIDAAHKYENFVNEWENIFSTYANKEDSQSVIMHGDPWCNNLMFKINDKSEPAEVRFLDWQIQRLGSPVLDILYFFFTSAAGSDLQNINKYLKEYHQSLSSFTRELGSDPEKLFPFTDLRKHVLKYGRYGLLFAISVLRFMYLDSDEVPSYADPDSMVRFSGTIKQEQTVAGRVKDAVLLAVRERII